MVCSTTWVRNEYPKPRAVIRYMLDQRFELSPLDVTCVSSRFILTFFLLKYSIIYSGCAATPTMAEAPVNVPKGTPPLKEVQLFAVTVGYLPGLESKSSFQLPPLLVGHQGSADVGLLAVAADQFDVE